MKKWFIVAVLLLAMTFCLTSNAESEVRHKVAENDVSIAIPDDWHYLDRDCDANDPYLDYLEITRDEFLEDFLRGNACCYVAGPIASDEQNHVSSMTFSIWDFPEHPNYTEYADATLIKYGEELGKALDISGKTEVVRVRLLGEKIRFIKIIRKRDSQYYSGTSIDILYRTVYNGKACSFHCTVPGAEYLNETEQVCDQIVSSLRFEGQNNLVSYKLDPLYMTISIPQEFVVMSEAERNAIDEKMNYLLYAHTPDRKFQVHVEIILDDIGLSNLNGLSDEEKKQFSEMMLLISDSMYGTGTSQCTLEEIDGVTYAKLLMNMKLEGKTFYELSYITVLNGKCFSITFDPEIDASGNYTSQSQEYMDAILQSVQYDEDVLQMNQATVYSEPGVKTYTVNDPKISIDIPAKYNVYWRNMPADAVSLYITGVSVDEIDQHFAEYPSVVLEASTENLDNEIKLFWEDEDVSLHFSSYDDDMIKRYIASVYNPGVEETGVVGQAYKIVRNDYNCYVVSSEIISEMDNPYYLVAYSMMGDHSLRLAYSSKEEISEEDERAFAEILKSIAIEGSKLTGWAESDWFSAIDVDPYNLQIGKLILSVPAYYLYYDKTNKDDLCLLSRGYIISALDQLLQQAGSGTDIYIADYPENRRILVKSQYADDVANFDLLNYLNYQLQFAKAMKSYESNGLLLRDCDTLISSGTENPDRSGYEIYWIRIKIENTQYDVEQVMYTTVINHIQYTITLEEKSVSKADEQEIESIIKGIVRDSIFK